MNDACPCQSGLDYKTCCEPLLTGKKLAKTALTLMRSRYTAYTRANMEYVLNTMKGPAAGNFAVLEAEKWARKAIWHGLDILYSDDNTVEFKAHYALDGEKQTLHEISLFKQIKGRWYYFDSQKPKKISRNASCPCGSGQKYKRCCGNQLKGT